MNRGNYMHSYSGNNYDKWVERNSNSTALGKVQKQFWFTKSAVIRKFGKKEDEHIVASDAELDAKIELFKAIESSTKDLQILLADYQNRICILAQEENSLGRLLKEYGKQESSRAGKMMTAVGKALSFTAQQRIAMRNPLVRLFQEVDTFQSRAVEDTCQTVEEMEKIRTEYRGALMWMKNVSKDFNPDHYQQLEKFREVQALVKQRKGKFDIIKIKSLQKIDLLAASRCNMFSHALILYQNNLISFCEKTAKSLNLVAANYKGYHPYRFQVIRELAEPQALMEDDDDEETEEIKPEMNNDDKTFFGAEYHDEENPSKGKLANNTISTDSKEKASKNMEKNLMPKQDQLINFDMIENLSTTNLTSANVLSTLSNALANVDLLTDNIPFDSNMTSEQLLKELFDSPVHKAADQLLPVFEASATTDLNDSSTFDSLSDDLKASSQIFLPSHLLDFGFDQSLKTTSKPSERSSSSALPKIEKQSVSYDMNKSLPIKEPQKSASTKNIKSSKHLDWFNAFQDIDPLSDPDNSFFGKISDSKKC